MATVLNHPADHLTGCRFSNVKKIIATKQPGQGTNDRQGQDGKWAIVVPPSVLGLLSDGDLALNVTLTDAAGNHPADHLTGCRFSNVKKIIATKQPGQGTNDRHGTVGQDGKWAIVVPPSVLGLLSDGDLALNVTLTDAPDRLPLQQC
jgi:hypothetical protein